MFNLMSNRSHRTFSAKLPPSYVAPSKCQCMGLLVPMQEFALLFVELRKVPGYSYIQHVLNECVIKKPEAAKKIFSLTSLNLVFDDSLSKKLLEVSLVCWGERDFSFLLLLFIFIFSLSMVVSIELKEEFSNDSIFLVHWWGWKLAVNIFYTKEGRPDIFEQKCYHIKM